MVSFSAFKEASDSSLECEGRESDGVGECDGERPLHFLSTRPPTTDSPGGNESSADDEFLLAFPRSISSSSSGQASFDIVEMGA